MKILIVEDEEIIAKRIKRLTCEILSEKISSIDICPELNDASYFITQNPIDLLLLDLNLNGQEGFEILRKLSTATFKTIIISAYKDRALEAFEYGVLDFVPKPFDKDRLEKAYTRYLNLKGESGDTPSQFQLAIKNNGRMRLVDYRTVLYIKASGNYSELHLRTGKKEMHDKMLDKLSPMLPNFFERVHKSYIVNMNEVKEYHAHSGSKYELVLRNNTVIPIGRTRYKQLREKWEYQGVAD